jgi:hypothetical protein
MVGARCAIDLYARVSEIYFRAVGTHVLAAFEISAAGSCELAAF